MSITQNLFLRTSTISTAGCAALHRTGASRFDSTSCLLSHIAEDLSSGEQGRTNLVVGRGHIAEFTVLDSLKLGHRVVQLTRDNNLTDTKVTTNGPLTSIKTPEKNFTDPTFYNETFTSHQINGVVVNCVGVPNGSEEEMRIANVKVPGAMAKGLDDSDATLIHFSSLGARYFEEGHMDCDYPKSKWEGEKEIEATGLKNRAIIRIPYCFQSPTIDESKKGKVGHIDNIHPYAVEHLVRLSDYGLWSPIIGTKEKAKDNRVPVVMSEDVNKVTRAIIKEPSKFHGKSIDAVSEWLSQGELLDLYGEALGVKIKKIHIPFVIASIMAQTIPYGHLQPYAINGLKVGEEIPEEELRKVADSSTFLETVEKPETVQKSLSRLQDCTEVTSSNPPIFQHIGHIVNSYITSSYFENFVS